MTLGAPLERFRVGKSPPANGGDGRAGLFVIEQANPGTPAG